MIRGHPLTAIIPVRGGSRGIPGKNLKRLGRDTLLERAIKLARHSPWVERILVSTDNVEMYEIARQHQAAAPSLRPAHLASDTATTLAVVEDLIETTPIKSGFLLLLQATSPLRTLADLDALCRAFEADSRAEAMVSLCAHDEPRPEKLQKLDENGFVRPYLGTRYEGPRQVLPQPLAFNGAFYLISREAFLREKSFLPARTRPFMMPPERSANLDSPADWLITRTMVEAGLWPLEELD